MHVAVAISEVSYWLLFGEIALPFLLILNCTALTFSATKGGIVKERVVEEFSRFFLQRFCFLSFTSSC